MFQLTLAEGKAVLALRSQFATLQRGEHLKYAPRVFTEHGAVMQANVLRSDIAVRASIQVVRAFVNLRRLLATNDTLLRKVERSNGASADTTLNYRTCFEYCGSSSNRPHCERSGCGFRFTGKMKCRR